MDCQIIDSKIILRAGSLVSVTPNHFGDNNCKDRYFGIVLHLTQDHKARVKWFEDDTISIEDLVLITLEVEVPKREKPKFTLRIKPNPETSCNAENIEFTPTINLDKDIVIPVDKSTPGPSKPKRHIPSKNYNEYEYAESDNDIEESKKGK